MYEKQLGDTLQKLFDFKRYKYELPSESQEQECLFIEIKQSDNQCTDGRFRAVVTGTIVVFCNIDKLPYGYFSKKIAEASYAEVGNLFFYNIEMNAGTFQNISQRSISFKYLYDSQYNPPENEITGLISGFTEEEQPS